MSEKEIEFMNLQLEKAAHPPAVDRERRLRDLARAVELQAVNTSYELGSGSDVWTECLICGQRNAHLPDCVVSMAKAALADQPPPDPHTVTFTQVNAYEWITKCSCGWAKRAYGMADAAQAECDLHQWESKQPPPDPREAALEKAVGNG